MRQTLNLYFVRLYLKSFFSTLVAVFALVYLIDMIEVSRRGQMTEFGFGAIALFSALRVPAFIEQAFPFIVLFSSIFTMLSLNRKLELVVARAAGVSIWQIVAPFVVGSVVIGLAAILLYNPLSAYAKARAADFEAETIGGGQMRRDDQVPWLRQNGNGVESIIGAQSVGSGGATLGNVTVFVFDGKGKVKERVDASRATLGDQEWLLREARVTRIGYTPVTLAEFRLPTSLKPEYVEQRLADPEAIPIWQLGSKIAIAASLGMNAQAFSMQYNTLIARPALFVAMTLLAATVATRFARTGQSGRTIVLGVLAGFVLYVVTFLAQALGSNSVVPPVIAAWFPVVAAGLFGVTILLHQEDG
ncbi:LPS export ABC transporter permease LptG [Aurantimonas sp. Leaf443]|uniref:LPS export ABC transporter permease LptG n=1 Tax=Aurantimonas sp. Leaf443 TaxID=1736378 RepID=UPI000AF995C3|nr:LPS export ABC transporter permease LptG [Aurantimonas sp. Leaf443]